MNLWRGLAISVIGAVGLTLASCVAIEVQPTTFFYEDPAQDRQSGDLPTGADHVEVLYACGTVDLIRWPGPSETTILYFGGNDFRIRRHAERLKSALPTEASVVMFDYPGRGGTTGSPTPECFVAAGAAVAEWSKARSRTLVLHGFSFGGFMASEVGRTSDPNLIVLEATAVSARSWAQARAGAAGGVIPVHIPTELARYDNGEALSQSTARIWVVVGEADRVAGVEQSQALYDRLKAAGRDVTLDRYSGGHGGAFSSPAAREAYLSHLRTR